MLDSKALSEAAMGEVLLFIDAPPSSPSRARIRFILRSAELLAAKLGDLRLQPDGWNGWVLQVHGKGAKNRLAAVHGQALTVLQDYLVSRHEVVVG